MKIAVVGAGAMGSLFGALLAESGAEVWLLDVWPEHVSAVARDGLQIEREGRNRRVKMQAVTDPAKIGAADLVIIFVKSTHTVAAAKVAAGLMDPGGMALTLQNGLGNADVIARSIPPSRIIAGTTAHGATMLGAGHIRHAGVGSTTIGLWAPDADSKIEPVNTLFATAGIATEVVENVRTVIWNKLLVNVGINAITALTGIKNGQILDLAPTRNLCRMAVEEGMAVARAHQIDVREDAVDHVLAVARATAANRSSMGQDVDHCRPTEIRTINGAVVREAEKVGLATPVNETLSILVETLQAHY